MKMSIKTYSELSTISSFEDRIKYLKLDGKVGEDTFGFDRYLNQNFYRTSEWKKIRDYVIVRDSGCDLGIPDHEIVGKVFVHHMNPICKDDILDHNDELLDPEYLICVSKRTHDMIHYGGQNEIQTCSIDRKQGDTKLW